MKWLNQFSFQISSVLNWLRIGELKWQCQTLNHYHMDNQFTNFSQIRTKHHYRNLLQFPIRPSNQRILDTILRIICLLSLSVASQFSFINKSPIGHLISYQQRIHLQMLLQLQQYYLIMKLLLLLTFLALLQYSNPLHIQAVNPFAAWINNSTTTTNTNTNAFTKWINGSVPQPATSNPAFSTWLNSSSTTTVNSTGVNPFNDPSFANILRGQIGNQNTNNNQASNDNAFRAFLQANNVPNATLLPTLQQCSRYTIRAGGNIYQPTNENYKVTCSLPGGKNYVENCYGKTSCDYLTCKFLKCSKVPGGAVYRVKI